MAAVAAIASEPAVRPKPITGRSPTRSASTPQASSVDTVPSANAVNTAVTSTSDSPNACWMTGPSAGRPPWTADSAAVAPAPTASTTQRYPEGEAPPRTRPAASDACGWGGLWLTPSSLCGPRRAKPRPADYTGVTGFRFAGHERSREAYAA